MMEMLSFYKWTLIAGMTMAPTLAMIGTQLAARDQAVQALVLSQASALGVVFGLAGMIVLSANTDHFSIIPLGSAFILSSLVFLALEKILPKARLSRNSFYVTSFALLLALTYLITALIPQLESHMSSVYFGDIAVASEAETKVATLTAVLSTAFLMWRWRTITDHSFQLALFGYIQKGRDAKLTPVLFLLVALITISLSIQTMGLLFTLGCLFIPSSLLVRRGLSLNRHTAEVAVAAILAAGSGILFSLHQSRLPTVPAVILLLFAVALGLRNMSSE